MPVYLLTFHTYRSWSEAHPKGYVQRGQGLQPADPDRARWRASRATDVPCVLTTDDQRLTHATIAAVLAESGCRLHAVATAPTHAHVLLSLRSPACTCGASPHCRRGCPARSAVELLTARLKRKCGQQLAKRHQTVGRPYLSRGWDLTPIRDRPHFDHLVNAYLPEHLAQHGVFRRW